MKRNTSPHHYSKRETGYPNGRKSGLKNFLRTRHGKVIFITACVVLILVGSTFVGGEYLLSKIGHMGQNEFGLADSVPSDETASGPGSGYTVDNDPAAMHFGTGPILSDPDIQNILLIGSDTRGNEKYGRSDSMLLLSVNHKTNQVKMVSFLRDLYVKIDGMKDNRINASFAYGGPKLLIDTIQNNFRIKIDKYVCVDFSSFQKAIDAVGGVSINLTSKEAQELNANPGVYGNGMQKVSPGLNRLNGATALGYARIRHIDSDFGRTQRQRNVLQALMTSVKHSSPGTMLQIANTVFPLLKTDLNNSEIIGLISQASSFLNNQSEQISVPQTGAYQAKYIRKMNVLVPDIEKNKQIIWKFLYNK